MDTKLQMMWYDTYSISFCWKTHKVGGAQAAFYVIDIWNVSHWNEIANISCFY